ncbi:MAG: site-specific integrase, partial [Holosporales bacterium]|nr:site-specific integrase [Holosporales bacterium]
MTHSLSVVYKEWLQSILFAKSRSTATQVAYDSDFRSFVQFYERYTGKGAELEDIIRTEPKDWRAWFSQQRNDGLDVKTLARRLSALKSFFKFLVQKEYIKDHPIFSARNPNIPQTLPRPATYDEIQLLMQSCCLLPGPDWVHKRDQSLIFLIYSVGLRINEALQLNYSDVIAPHVAQFGRSDAAQYEA